MYDLKDEIWNQPRMIPKLWNGQQYAAYDWALWDTVESVVNAEDIKKFDPFDILDVSPYATGTEIKTSYRKLSLLYHPDKNSDDPLAASRFIQITKAFQALTDDHARDNYEKYGNPDRPQTTRVSEDNDMLASKIYRFLKKSLLSVRAAFTKEEFPFGYKRIEGFMVSWIQDGVWRLLQSVIDSNVFCMEKCQYMFRQFSIQTEILEYCLSRTEAEMAKMRPPTGLIDETIRQIYANWDPTIAAAALVGGRTSIRGRQASSCSESRGGAGLAGNDTGIAAKMKPEVCAAETGHEPGAEPSPNSSVTGRRLPVDDPESFTQIYDGGTSSIPTNVWSGWSPGPQTAQQSEKPALPLRGPPPLGPSPLEPTPLGPPPLRSNPGKGSGLEMGKGKGYAPPAAGFPGKGFSGDKGAFSSHSASDSSGKCGGKGGFGCSGSSGIAGGKALGGKGQPASSCDPWSKGNSKGPIGAPCGNPSGGHTGFSSGFPWNNGTGNGPPGGLSVPRGPVPEDNAPTVLYSATERPAAQAEPLQGKRPPPLPPGKKKKNNKITSLYTTDTAPQPSANPDVAIHIGTCIPHADPEENPWADMTEEVTPDDFLC